MRLIRSVGSSRGCRKLHSHCELDFQPETIQSTEFKKSALLSPPSVPQPRQGRKKSPLPSLPTPQMPRRRFSALGTHRSTFRPQIVPARPALMTKPHHLHRRHAERPDHHRNSNHREVPPRPEDQNRTGPQYRREIALLILPQHRMACEALILQPLVGPQRRPACTVYANPPATTRTPKSRKSTTHKAPCSGRADKVLQLPAANRPSFNPDTATRQTSQPSTTSPLSTGDPTPGRSCARKVTRNSPKPARNNPVGANLNFSQSARRLNFPQLKNPAHCVQSPPAPPHSRKIRQIQPV